MPEKEENSEQRGEDAILEGLRWLRKGAGLNLRRLQQQPPVVAAIERKARMEGAEPGLAAREALKFLLKELRDLGESDEAQATRNAFAVGQEHNPHTLTQRREDFAMTKGRHPDTIEAWENHGIEELASSLGAVLAQTGARFSSLPSSSDEGESSLSLHKELTQHIPSPILRYIQMFPEFAVEHELRAQYVRTSRESFMAAARCICESLTKDEQIFGTDAISFDRDHIIYWARDGLEYLRINYEAARRGVDITRVFVLSARERQSHSDLLTQLGAIQAAAGVTPQIAIYEELPPTCRYEFALFGAHLMDEVIYDIHGNMVIDNHIHWSQHKMAAFRERAHLIRNYIDPGWRFPQGEASSFEAVIALARKFGDNIKKLKLPR